MFSLSRPTSLRKWSTPGSADDSSGVGQLRSISWMSGSLKPCTHHLALALYPVSVSFQQRTRREEITRSLCVFSLIASACVESIIVTALKSSTPCHSVSIAFENCGCSSSDKWFQDTSSAFPSTEGKILQAAGSPRPTQSKRFGVPCFHRRRSFVSPPLFSGCSSLFLF